MVSRYLTYNLVERERERDVPRRGGPESCQQIDGKGSNESGWNSESRRGLKL